MSEEIRLMISVSPEKFEELFCEAQKTGFMRENPRKRITTDEKKEAIRWLFNRKYKTDV